MAVARLQMPRVSFIASFIVVATAQLFRLAVAGSPFRFSEGREKQDHGLKIARHHDFNGSSSGLHLPWELLKCEDSKRKLDAADLCPPLGIRASD